MAGIDPLAATPAAVGAIVEAELARLASDAAALRAELTAGDVVPARVLPPNGLTDLLEILGRRVAASLPPDLKPNQGLTVKVTGFDGDRILLQVLAADESAPPPPVAPSPAVFVAATIVPRTTPPAPPGSPPPPPVPPEAPASPAAEAPPPEAVPEPWATSPAPSPPATSFTRPAVVAQPPAANGSPPASRVPGTPFTPPPSAPAAVPPATSPPAGPPAQPVAADPGRTIVVAPPRSVPPPASPVTRSPLPEGAPPSLRLGTPIAAGRPAPPPPPAAPRDLPGAPGAPPPRPAVPSASTPVEARIAAQRTGTAPLVPEGRPVPPPPLAPAGTPGPGRFVAPPPIAVRDPAVAPPPRATPGAPAAPVPNAPRDAAAFADPPALLRALRLPVTPTNIANARLALESPARLPAALDALDRALGATADPRAQTLRTIAAFVTRLDPAAPTFAAQLQAYVEHVVAGTEQKLLTLAGAHTAAAAAPVPEALADPVPAAAPSPPPATAAAGATPATPSAAPPPLPEPPVPVVAQARVAERELALQYDLKGNVLALQSAPPPGAPPLLAPALADVAASVTAQQLVTAQQSTPQQLVLAFPIATPQGVAHAEVRVDRDQPEPGRGPLDGDDFHIAFVLETANLGVVAIDLKTVGRVVDLAVRTETVPAAARFGDALAGLRERLEALRYRVASSDATIARGAGEVVETRIGAPPGGATDPNAVMDRRA